MTFLYYIGIIFLLAATACDGLTGPLRMEAAWTVQEAARASVGPRILEKTHESQVYLPNGEVLFPSTLQSCFWAFADRLLF